jgi:hypothetical protein
MSTQNLTELLRQFLISLLESSGGTGIQAAYDAQLVNKAKLQEPRYQTLVVTDRQKSVASNATAAQRKIYYTVLVKVILSPQLGGILLKVRRGALRVQRTRKYHSRDCRLCCKAHPPS